MNYRIDIEIFSEKQKLDNLFKMISKIDNDELKSHWARYLCVLVSGFLENAVRIIFSKYAASKSHPNISNFVNNKIKRITNLKYENIKQLLCSFDKGWYDDCDTYFDDELRDTLDTLVANRNNITHGRMVGLTYNRISGLYENILKIVSVLNDDFLEKN